MLLHSFTSQKEPEPDLDLNLDGFAFGTVGLFGNERVAIKAAAWTGGRNRQRGRISGPAQNLLSNGLPGSFQNLPE